LRGGSGSVDAVGADAAGIFADDSADSAI
jgi:hypothetical protein